MNIIIKILIIISVMSWFLINVVFMLSIPYIQIIPWGLVILTILVGIYFKINKKKYEKSMKETYSESDQFENLSEDEYEKNNKKQDWEGL